MTGTALPRLTTSIDRRDLVRYAGASGDFNPIHWSDRAAMSAGLSGVVAHGMLVMGLAMRAAGDPSRVRSSSVRFLRPVVVPEDESVPVEVDGVAKEGNDDTVLEFHVRVRSQLVARVQVVRTT